MNNTISQKALDCKPSFGNKKNKGLIDDELINNDISCFAPLHRSAQTPRAQGDPWMTLGTCGRLGEGAHVDLVLNMRPWALRCFLSIETKRHKVKMVSKRKLTMTWF
jgi:hypothetical protein